MKKSLIALSALSVLSLSACGTHNDYDHGNMQQSNMSHDGWDHKEHMRMMAQNYFDQMDKNGDGIITRKEFDSYNRMWFKEADSNHNGKLTFEEFMAQIKREKEKMMPPRDHVINDGDMHNGDSPENTQSLNPQSRY